MAAPVTGFDWYAVSSARIRDHAVLTEMVTNALLVLADLLDDTDHACAFTVTGGPLLDGDVFASVDALLPPGCTASDLAPVGSWADTVRATLPGWFTTGQPELWTEQSPARELADGLVEWSAALLGRIWPPSAAAWELTVNGGGSYEAAYFDLVVRVDDRVWLLHLEVAD